MKYYLLAMYQPVGDPPPPETLEPIMRDLAAVKEEMRAAGVGLRRGAARPGGIYRAVVA